MECIPYRKVIVHYCGEAFVTDYSGFLLREREVLVEVKYVYMSIADEALTRCFIVSNDYKRVLGSIAIGKVVRIGTGIQGIFEGDRVIVFPLSGRAPVDIDGAGQEMYSVNERYVLESSQKAYNDIEMLLIATLSIHRKMLENVKGLSTLVVGNDLSILPFVYYSTLYSPRFAIVPQYTLWPEVIKGEHVSMYNSGKKFDVIILASSDPLVSNIILRNYQDASTIIIHPSISSILRMSNLLSSEDDKHIMTMRFGDIGIGIEVFNTFRDHLIKRIDVVKINSISKSIKAPLIVQIN